MKPVFESIQDYQNRVEDKRTKEIRVGDYVACKIEIPGTGTHVVQPLFKTSIREFDEWKKSFILLVCWRKQDLFFVFAGAVVSNQNSVEKLVVDQS